MKSSFFEDMVIATGDNVGKDFSFVEMTNINVYDHSCHLERREIFPRINWLNNKDFSTLRFSSHLPSEKGKRTCLLQQLNEAKLSIKIAPNGL